MTTGIQQEEASFPGLPAHMAARAGVVDRAMDIMDGQPEVNLIDSITVELLQDSTVTTQTGEKNTEIIGIGIKTHLESYITTVGIASNSTSK